MSLTDNTTNLQNLLTAVQELPDSLKIQASKTVVPTTSVQTVKPDSGYDGLSQVTVNAMPTATQATPTVSIDSAGKITATATQSAGYVAAGTKTGTKQLTTQAAQTITPGTSNKTIASGRYLTGTQTIKGDANLLPENIKSGVSIFDIIGTLEAGGGGDSGGAGSGLTLLASGTFTPRATITTKDYPIQHNSGIVPSVVAISTRSSASSSGTDCLVARTDDGLYITMYRYRTGNSYSSVLITKKGVIGYYSNPEWTENEVYGWFNTYGYGKTTYTWQVYA